MFEIYANDFDVDGQKDIVLGYSENGINYPVAGLNASSRQIPFIGLRYKRLRRICKGHTSGNIRRTNVESLFALQGKYICTSMD